MLTPAQLSMLLEGVAFGRSSERLTRESDQLELGLEEAEAQAAASVPPAVARARDAAKPHRQPLPDHLPREDVLHEPACVNGKHEARVEPAREPEHQPEA